MVEVMADDYEQMIERETRELMEISGLDEARARQIVLLNHDDPRGEDVQEVNEDGEQVEET